MCKRSFTQQHLPGTATGSKFPPNSRTIISSYQLKEIKRAKYSKTEFSAPFTPPPSPPATLLYCMFVNSSICMLNAKYGVYFCTHLCSVAAVRVISEGFQISIFVVEK